MRLYRVAFIPESGIDPQLHLLADEADKEESLLVAEQYAEQQFVSEEWHSEGYTEYVARTREQLQQFGLDGRQQIMMVPYGVIVII